jgi:hypothetical protein
VRLAAAVIALAAVAPVLPARAEPGPTIRAAPLAGRIQVDGRLDEPEWLAAEPFRDFVRIAPIAGGAPGERTEVRVLQSDGALYVAVRCFDSEPGRIVRPLGRRDRPPRSDQITVYVHAGGDPGTAAAFQLTAGGIESDALVYDDDRFSWDWDAVWEGAVAVDEEGWSAELAIPVSALAPGGADVRLGVIREVARTHERSATFPLPRDARALASRLGPVEGLEPIDPGVPLALAPYVAARLAARPQYADPSRPSPRLVDPLLDAGLDLRARAGGLSVAAALNPDFSQVEADQVIQNLTTFETFLPEKRPFFTERFEVFQPVGAGNESVPHQLFYSRRIGLGAPILAAAKVAGDARDDLRIGLLDVVVAGTGQPAGAREDLPRRTLRWSPAQPLRLAPADAYPTAAPAPENRLAAVARWRAAPGLSLGAQATSALAIAPTCSPADAASDAPPAACAAVGGEAGALDFQAVSQDAAWYAYGQGAVSRAGGGPPERILRDGIVVRRGDPGAGAYLRAGKRGGEPLRFDLGWTYSAPRLDLNASGFQRTQNEQEGTARVAFARPRVTGPLDALELYVSGFTRRTTDGRDLRRGQGATAGLSATLARSHATLDCSAGSSADRWDVREIAGTGIPLRMPGAVSGDCTLATDPARPLSLSLELYGERSGGGPGLDRPWSGGTVATVALRPHDRVETRLSVVLDHTELPLRWVGDDGAGHLLFARQEAPSASLLLTQTWVLARRLTLQLHGQLFTAYERYDDFRAATPHGAAPIGPGDLSRAAAPATSPDGRTTVLVVDAVLRWEPRPGATLFVVYARNQAGAPADGPVARTLSVNAARPGPVTDAVLVKWTWWTRT